VNQPTTSHTPLRPVGSGSSPSQLDDSEHDIFRDPALSKQALSRSAKEDPLFRWIEGNWRSIGLTILACAAVYYIVTVFKQTRTESMQRAGDLYIHVRQDYREYLTLNDKVATLEQEAGTPASSAGADSAAKLKAENDKKISEAKESALAARQRLDQALRSLADAKQPYAGISAIYLELLARTDGKSSQNPGTWLASAAVRGDIGLELDALIRARGMLDADATYIAGRTLLKELATSSNYVATSAAISLAKVSTTAQEKEEAKQVVEALAKRQPEQAEILSKEAQY